MRSGTSLTCQSDLLVVKHTSCSHEYLDITETDMGRQVSLTHVNGM